MAVLPAHLVATPVLERLGGEARGVVLGAGATAAWVDLDGFVVAITTREAPLLPNAIALAAGSGTLPRSGLAAGTPARVAPGRVDLGPLRITWSPADPPTWDPTVPVPRHAGPTAVAERGAALRIALGAVDNGPPVPSASATLPLLGPKQPGGTGSHAPVRLRGRGPQQPEIVGPQALVRELARLGLPTAAEPGGATGLTMLFEAVRARDPGAAAGATRELLGRGPGLTPEGDDLLAAVAGTLAVLGPATGVDGPPLAALKAALAPIPGRTSALSATLLRLAAERRLAEPVGRLLDLDPAAETAWPAALSRLERLGHGSGRAYAAGVAAAASMLAAGARLM
jgi:Protein of unknown function (DUF2877)